MLALIKVLLGLSFAILLVGCGYESQPSVQVGSNQGTSDNGTPGTAYLEHDLKVYLDPNTKQIRATDTLIYSGKTVPSYFILSAGVTVSSAGQRLEPREVRGEIAVFELPKADENGAVHIEYYGNIESTEQCDWLRASCRLLNARGAYLDAGSYWYPQVSGTLHKFKMQVKVPEDWVSLSQGKRVAANTWLSSQPQTDIYLLAGPYQVYESRKNDRSAMVYLLQADESLANTYLNATHNYLAQYSEMLGDYPYDKFATVESFWETGWGMPSFTLLGSRVIRLPFIPYTSFPHEILHNWWGNSVYIDAREGNWAEGLTAYLADHRAQKMRGLDASYRRDALQKFSIFASGSRDFPLSQFRSRHDHATQAVGYSKSMMIFHMLRKQLGEDDFWSGMRQFYRSHQFKTASFRDLQASFESVSGRGLDVFFDQWLTRPGAPILTLREVSRTGGGDLKVTLSQKTAEQEPYDLLVPVQLTDESGKVSRIDWHLRAKSQTFHLPADIKEIQIDPDFDLMRLPHPDELPESLNSLLGTKVLYFEPSESEAQNSILRRWAAERNRELQDISAKDVDTSPVTILLNPEAIDPILDASAVTLADTSFDRSRYSAAFAIPHDEQQIALLAPDVDALEHLLQKLQHYGKYSYIAFDAATGKNVAKGQWPVLNSPMHWSVEP